MSSGIVFDIRKFAVRDGPGIRTAVFLKGCPLRCLWCHNPEGLSSEPELVRRSGRCVAPASFGGCRACERACDRAGALAAADADALAADAASGAANAPARGPCGGCDELRAGKEPACEAACPAGAYEAVGRRWDTEQVLAELGRDAAFYARSGGGATFSGGEPLLQGAFLLELLESCRAAGIASAVDTSGWAGRDLVLEAAKLADLWLYDVKLVDEGRHLAATGVPSGPILANLEALARAGARLRVRYPLVPGVNDGPEDLRAAARLAARLASEARSGWEVDLLPYHDSARGKYRLRGTPYPIGDIRPPSAEDARRAAAVFEGEGLAVGIGGAR